MKQSKAKTKTKSEDTHVKHESEELESLRGQLARCLADYDNLQKRIEREREELRESTSFRLILRLLPIFDMLESAQKHIADPGLAIVVKEFGEVLQLEGAIRINSSAGVSFNENEHEAIEVLENDKEDGIIAEEVMSGWKFVEGRVIRPAKVKVWKKQK